MKFALVPALLAGVAQGFLYFTTDIPVDSYYDVDTDFTLEWEPEDDPGTFELRISSYLVNPIISTTPYGEQTVDFQSQSTVLSTTVKFSDGKYTWNIEPIADRTGGDWWYDFEASYDYTLDATRSFHLQA
ncbi:hypothetical protein GGR52DRAFT_327540 [Hypoxylon sp. FL1284]|nr:hypothetical protein GGR52DRAFT_327540 [Hypoxylon sp. FL1284]